MAQFKLQEEDRKEYLNEHLFYEIEMMIRGNQVSNDENIQVEIVLLHARNLIGFYFDMSSLVTANDFVPNFSTADWPERGRIYGEICNAVSHMGSRPIGKKWPLCEIIKHIVENTNIFLDSLAPKYRFVRLEKLKSDMKNELARHQILTIGGTCTSTTSSSIMCEMGSCASEGQSEYFSERC